MDLIAFNEADFGEHRAAPKAAPHHAPVATAREHTPK